MNRYPPLFLEEDARGLIVTEVDSIEELFTESERWAASQWGSATGSLKSLKNLVKEATLLIGEEPMEHLFEDLAAYYGWPLPPEKRAVVGVIVSNFVWSIERYRRRQYPYRPMSDRNYH